MKPATYAKTIHTKPSCATPGLTSEDSATVGCALKTLKAAS